MSLASQNLAHSRAMPFMKHRYVTPWLTLVVCLSGWLSGWLSVLPTTANAATVRYDLFVRSFSGSTSGAGLYRLHGNSGEVLYYSGSFPGFSLTTGPDGAVYLSQVGRVVRLDPEIDNRCSDCIVSVGFTRGRTGMAFGPDGAFYAAGQDQIWRSDFDQGGRPELFATLPVNEPFGSRKNIEALILGPDNHFYAGDVGGSSIWQVDGTTGDFISEFANDDSLRLTRGIAFGPDGNLYVAGLASGNIVRFDGSTGAFDQVFASGLAFPNGIAFGPDGDLYVALEAAGKIVRIDGTTGQLLGDFATGLGGNLVSITFAPVPVPEPASATLLASVGLVWITRRRRSE